MTHRIPEGNVGQVAKGLRQTVTKRKLSGSKAKILLSAAAYFHCTASPGGKYSFGASPDGPGFRSCMFT